MKLKVTGRQIEVTEPGILTSNAVDVDTAEFTFDETWSEYGRTAVFKSGSIRKEVPLVTDSCIIPWEVLQNEGWLSIGVYGTKDTEVLPTVYAPAICVHSGAEPSESAEAPTPGIYAQIMDEIALLRESIPEADAEDADTVDHRLMTHRDASDQHPISAVTGLQAALDGKQPSGSYALRSELFSGSYDDLTGKPSIPAPITESTVAGWGFTKNAGTYVKPSGGIPKRDLSSSVKSSLALADTALQQHQDISGKLNSSPGAAYAGCFLIVDSDGEIVPMQMSVWQGGSF